MAAVNKKKNKAKYNIEKKEKTKEQKVENEIKQTKKTSSNKKSIIERIVEFVKGVRSEMKKVHWLDKKNMVKYSVATIAFIIFCSVFFYVINVLFALVQSVLN